MGRTLRLVAVVVGLTLVIALRGIRGLGVIRGFWIGFRDAPFAWWIVWPAAAFVVIGFGYLMTKMKT